MKRFCRILSPKGIWVEDCGLEVGDILETISSPSGEVLFLIKDGEVLKDSKGCRVWADDVDIQGGYLEMVGEEDLP